MAFAASRPNSALQVGECQCQALYKFECIFVAVVQRYRRGADHVGFTPVARDIPLAQVVEQSSRVE